MKKNKLIIEELKLEQTSYTLQPSTLITLGGINICSTIIIGITINLISSEESPSIALIVILLFAAIASIITATYPAITPYIIRKRIRKNNAN